MEAKPLYTMNPLTRFSNRADDYKYRPSYPDAAIELILEDLPPPTELTIADIGAGPGTASILFAKRGVHVLAIEPNAAMRESGISHPLIEFYAAQAEETTLPDSCVDVVTCFSSFQWFNPEASFPEFRRILKPSGKLVIGSNAREQNDEFTKNYVQLLHKIVDNHPPEKCYLSVESLRESPYFDYIGEYTFNNRHELNLDELIRCTMSYSTIPREGEIHQTLIDSLQELFSKFCNEKGTVSLFYRTIVHLAK